MSGTDEQSALEQLGGRLRTERERVGLSLRALAGRLDISASALSQIETGRSHPSVASLYAIASELEVPLDSLFARSGTAPGNGAERAGRQRLGERRVLELAAGVTWERLTDGDELLDFLHVTYEPGGASSDGLISHAGREYGLVLDGALTVTVADEVYVLGAGDSVCLNSHVPHRLANRGIVPVHAIWAVLQRG